MKYSLLVFFFLSACATTKYIKPEQNLLYNQSITGNQEILLENLEAFYRQKPNRRILVFPEPPYVSIYNMGVPKYRKNLPNDSLKLKELEQKISDLPNDSTLSENRKQAKIEKLKTKVEKLKLKIRDGNWLMRSAGEAPVVFDEQQMQQAAQQMQIFARKEGFFSAVVTPSFSVKKRRVEVIYNINEGNAHYLDSLQWFCEDSVIRKILKKDSLNCLLRPKTRYSESKIAAERDRIAVLMRDIGFMNFSKQAVFFEIDTNQVDTLRKNALKVKIYVKNQHKRYSISEVNFTSDAQNLKSSFNKKHRGDTVILNDINYIQYQQLYSPKVLDERIALRKDDYFSQSNIQKTQRALANMQVFKFVNIQFDSIQGGIRANIFANSLPLQDLSFESGVNVSQSWPGPFASFGYKKRNIFRAGDVFDVSAKVSLEAQAGIASRKISDLNTAYQSQEYTLNGSFAFPIMLLPINRERRDKIGIFDTKTRMQGGFIYTIRPEYTRFTMQGTFGYEWNNHHYSTFSFNLLNVGVINTLRLGDSFMDHLFDIALRGNTSLLYSFDRSLVTSSSASFTYNKASQTSNSVYFQTNLEAGGSYLNFLGNDFLERNPSILGMRYYRFFRLEIDFRHYKSFSKDRMFVSRLHLGAASAYGKNNNGDILPYEKHFFSGGSNSIRAWRPRRLGPGGYTPPILSDGSIDYSFEQPGELLIEANLEYRTKLFGFVNGAIFVDAGNVWLLREDARYGATFRLKEFWQEIAVGAGLGLRMDLSFIIMRFDMATKIFDPALPLGQRFVGQLNSFSDIFNKQNQLLLNIGIGYPF